MTNLSNKGRLRKTPCEKQSKVADHSKEPFHRKKLTRGASLTKTPDLFRDQAPIIIKVTL
jgi:hypothetical protein